MTKRPLEIDLPPISADQRGWPLDGPLAEYLDEVLPDEIKIESIGRQLVEDLGSLDL